MRKSAKPFIRCVLVSVLSETSSNASSVLTAQYKLYCDCHCAVILWCGSVYDLIKPLDPSSGSIQRLNIGKSTVSQRRSAPLSISGSYLLKYGWCLLNWRKIDKADNISRRKKTKLYNDRNSPMKMSLLELITTISISFVGNSVCTVSETSDNYASHRESSWCDCCLQIRSSPGRRNPPGVCALQLTSRQCYCRQLRVSRQQTTCV